MLTSIWRDLSGELSCTSTLACGPFNLIMNSEFIVVLGQFLPV